MTPQPERCKVGWGGELLLNITLSLRRGLFVIFWPEARRERGFSKFLL